MSWFGWLTKPKLEVTALDEITLVIELFVALLFYRVVIWEWLVSRSNKRGRRK